MTPKPLADHERALLFLAAVERPTLVAGRDKKVSCLMGITGWPRYRVQAAIEEAVQVGFVEEVDE